MLPVASTRRSYGTLGAVDEHHLAAVAVDVHDAGAEAEVDAVRGVPPGPRSVSASSAVGALEHGRQQDPVVRRVRLVAEHA